MTMKHKTVIILTTLMLLLLPVAIAYTAGAAVQSKEEGRGFRTIVWSCTSDGSGDVSGEGAVLLSGTVVGFSYDVGTSEPTDAFDVYLYDDRDDPVDILGGVGVDLPNGEDTSFSFAKMYRTPLTPDGAYVLLKNQTITPTVANAGDTKSFTLYLHLK
jgi:hypothetical protein